MNTAILGGFTPTPSSGSHQTSFYNDILGNQAGMKSILRGLWRALQKRAGSLPLDRPPEIEGTY
ncbi:hypothetical protein [Polynucleobacter sp. es-EL-1]|uniref:hypothetical protein n=1 Tax=Polynucleobacter sp. es-EL-1 TaxID=1855652 RepID=UPI001BFD16CC|nr:hypothetical protein [Polynucleobacter sp. es-EL-1]QWE11354.1 hypothetical protein FD974_04310 [Polynucleobacter sp. es-EL-1]